MLCTQSKGFDIPEQSVILMGWLEPGNQRLCLLQDFTIGLCQVYAALNVAVRKSMEGLPSADESKPPKP